MPLVEDFLTTGHLVITSPFNEDLEEIAAMCHELTAELDIIARDRSDYGGISEDSYHETLPVSMMCFGQRSSRRWASRSRSWRWAGTVLRALFHVPCEPTQAGHSERYESCYRRRSGESPFHVQAAPGVRQGGAGGDQSPRAALVIRV